MDRTLSITTISIVKGPDKFWDLDPYDLVFSESMDDSFGKAPKSSTDWITYHFD